jgi:2-succinyl-6-hydroxy-2,4-cyclohexadiene-1-carboxylate synthase
MTTAQPTGHTISINGVDLYYEKSGKGQPLLLLHGWTQTSAFWKYFTSEFESEYEIYAVDLRGHGRSSPARLYKR